MILKKNNNIILGGKSYSMDFVRKNNINFPEIKQIQKNLLNVYRLTDEYRKAYGEYIMSNYPNGLGMTSTINAIKKFKKIKNVDVKKYKSLIIDLLYSVSVLGFTKYEYFCYGFENMPISERLKFISNTDIFSYYKIMNKDSKQKKILGNKYLTYNKFKDFYKRDLIQINFVNDKEVFRDFCKKHEKFIIKPIGGAMGRKIKIINVSDFESWEEAYRYLANFNVSIVCEELIVQSSEFSKFHENSVNSIRIFTYFNGEKSNIVCAWFKTGQGNAIVDNGGSGGILAAIDKESGVIITNGSDEKANNYVKHPNSGIKFNGFKINKWDELVDIALKLSRQLPEVPLIGWDFALSMDKGWQLIEGNEEGQIFLIQIPLKSGCKEEFESIFEWSKWKRKEVINQLKKEK